MFRHSPTISRNALRNLMCLACILLLAGVTACSKAPREAQGMLDTPLHHYETGMRLLDAGDLAGAQGSFGTALELDDGYGPALAGNGLVLAMQGDVKESLELIRSGQRKADRSSDSPERMWTLVAEQRAYIALHKLGKISDSALVRESRRAFGDARIASPDAAMPWFWQGEAYLQALAFEEARAAFREAQTRDIGYGEKASERLALLERIIRASLKTSVGKRIALVDKITRADMAALLVEELGIERFFEGTEIPEASTFQSPQDMKSGDMDAVSATDIQSHPLRVDVQSIMKYRLRGLQPFADHTFQPDRPLTRAEAALILEDIFIRAKNDTALATRFVGQSSPFPDVRNDHPFFNAAMFATTRGLLHADVAKGLFRPVDSISGVDAVLLINALKTELDVF